jgi:hypothetical protein
MAHLAQHLGNGIHTWPTNTNDVNSSRPAEIKKRVDTHDAFSPAALSTTSAIEQLRCTSPSFLAVWEIRIRIASSVKSSTI